MKRVGRLYERMLDIDIIKDCIIMGSRGKRKRQDVRTVLADVEGYAAKVLRLLSENLYVPTVPRRVKIFDSSCQKERDIKIVPFYPDGIIQQLVVYVMKNVIVRGMYNWSCASIPGRGNIRATRYVQRALRADPRGTKHAGKFDIYHYYPSIDRRKVIAALKRKIKDRRFIAIVKDIIDSDPDYGLSIGFYLNQWLANFYLEPLDHFICRLDGVKYYVRNMDDLVIMGPNKKKLHKAREAIARYLETVLGLQMKENWQIFPTDSRGIDFVGYRFFHGRTILRKRNFKKLRRNVRTVRKFTETGRKIPFHTAAGLLSRAGQLKHCDGWHVYERYVLPITERKLKETVRRHALAERSRTNACTQPCNQ